MSNNRMHPGDQPVMPFTCYDGDTTLHDLTAAANLTVYFPLKSGLELQVTGSAVVILNQTTAKGQFTVDFIGVDTTNFKIAKDLSVRIEFDQGGRHQIFKGIALDVLDPRVG